MQARCKEPGANDLALPIGFLQPVLPMTFPEPEHNTPPAKKPANKYRPHPEELASVRAKCGPMQASRRMDATHGFVAILRDAARSQVYAGCVHLPAWPLLRMRSEITFTGFEARVHNIAGLFA
jgi:hypothetical protein